MNSIYRHIVENYKYYSDPRSSEFIQSPYDTIKVKGGDCEDLTILLNSLLENIGIKTYIVLTKTHAYSLACGINIKGLEKYAKRSLIEYFASNLNLGKNREIKSKNGQNFIVFTQKQSFVLKPNNYYFYGESHSKIQPSSTHTDFEYEISSRQPLTIYFVPSKEDYDKLAANKQFNHYPTCKKENVLKVKDSCNNLQEYGGIVLVNNNPVPSTVDFALDINNYFSQDILDFDNGVSYYDINGEKCVVLEPTRGPEGYPGDDRTSQEEKIAIDPVTKEYYELK